MKFISPDRLLLSDADDTHHPAADGLRVFAMLGVMWYHIWQQSWLEPSFTLFGHNFNFNYLVRSGYLLVDIFLFLSAFLLFMPYAKSILTSSPMPSIGSFYKKRAVRILPSYYLCVLVLFVFACIDGKYISVPAMLKDLISHLTFTHMTSPDTYLYTNLNPALWTLAIEFHFYLIFPFLARAFRKLPLITYASLVLLAFWYRNGFVRDLQDTAFYINQFPAMLDLFANGMLASYAYASLARKVKKDKCFALLSTLGMLIVFYLFYLLFESQTKLPDYESIRLGQMDRRYPFGILLSFLMIFSGFALRPVKFLFGNRVMRFLSSISFHAYMWHSFLAEKFKQWRFPPYEALEHPNANNEPIWQWQYTLLCFTSALLLSAVLTYAFERPLAKRLLRPKRPANK